MRTYVSLRRRGDFARVGRRGERTTGVAFVALTTRGAGERSRIGITVSKAVGNAVVRNRLRRRVKAILDRTRFGDAPYRDVVLIARPGAGAFDAAMLAEELARLLDGRPRGEKRQGMRPAPIAASRSVEECDQSRSQSAEASRNAPSAYRGEPERSGERPTNAPSARLLIALVRAYKCLASPLLPPACRFVPSCSEYAATAIEKHGTINGVGLAVRRIVRCAPWHPGGFDPVPEGHRSPQS